MKKILLILLSVVMLSLSSCGDFLKEQSSELSYVTSCYGLNELLIGNGYMRRSRPNSMSLDLHYYPWLNLMDDDVEEYINDSYEGRASVCGFFRSFYTWQEVPFVYVNGVPRTDYCWSKMYKHISNMNLIISHVNKFPNDPEEIRKSVTGEAQFLRAAYYFMLVNIYAKPYNAATASTDLGVPLKITEYVEDKYFNRQSVQQIYDQIVADLKNAAENLSGIQQKSIYRANEAAARLLLSRVYLYMNQWQLSIDEADKVIALGVPIADLNSYSFKISTPSGASYPERAQYLLSQTNKEVIFTQGETIQNFLKPTTETKNGGYKPSRELLDLYSKYNTIEGTDTLGVDLRIPLYFIQLKDSGIWIFAKCETNHTKSTVSEMFVLRAAEAYLNKAEAEAMLNKADAVQTMETFLKTRFRGVIPSIGSLTNQKLVEFVREERRRELCIECHRWFDLRRYAVCSKYPETKEIIHQVYTDKSNPNVASEAYVLNEYGQEPAYLLPIPGYEMEFNKGEMIQNEFRVPRLNIF